MMVAISLSLKRTAHVKFASCLTPALAFLILTGCTTLSASKDAQNQMKVLATHPAPTFLENLAVSEADVIYYTDYSARQLRLIEPNGSGAVFAQLDTHPVSITSLDSGWLVLAQKVPFTAGPSFLGSGEALVIGKSGDIERRIPLESVGFANGVLLLDQTTALIADSVGSKIVALDLPSGKVSEWLADPRLAPASEPTFLPGANGLKRRGNTLYVSTSAGRAIYSVPLSGGNPTGELQPVVTGLPGVDDFALLDDGSFVIATHGTAVIHVAADRTRKVLADNQMLAGNTAVAVTGVVRQRSIIILGTGGFSEGLGKPAVVASLEFPD